MYINLYLCRYNNVLIKRKNLEYFKMPWLVVKFDLENTVEAVPKNWCCEKTSTCYWPPDSCSSSVIEEKIKNQHTPDRSLWKPYPAVILGQYGKFCLSTNALVSRTI